MTLSMDLPGNSWLKATSDSLHLIVAVKVDVFSGGQALSVIFRGSWAVF